MTGFKARVITVHTLIPPSRESSRAGHLMSQSVMRGTNEDKKGHMDLGGPGKDFWKTPKRSALVVHEER